MGKNTSNSENEMYFALKSELYRLMYNIFAISQTDKILATLERMRSLVTDNLQEDFASCESLVQRWFDHWFPPMNN